ncbi:MAG: DUF5660 family protein [Patescibacteria group bacterium]
MQTLYQKKPPVQTYSANPFARALAETEKNATTGPRQADTSISEALAKTGGQLPTPNGHDNESVRRQQEAMWLEQQKRVQHERLRRRLHEQINPVESHAVFDARQKQVAEEISKLREELKMLSKDVAAFDKEVELTLMTTVVEPGQTGSYFINFFQKLRQFIMLLRSKVQSARTWATQMSQKSAKKRKRGHQPGLDLAGQEGSEKTTSVHDMMHHERGQAYSGA